METILSAGIDIGTTTTQVIFSELKIVKKGGFGEVPRFEIADKHIIYRSPVFFTPLDGENIDALGVKALVANEYKKAGFLPEDMDSGAVIVTGESARKENAKTVVEELASFAGDFVVAIAGPELESVLAAKGAGALDLSTRTGNIVINYDIGGGTTNVCVFKDGKMVDNACLDIGGRQIRFLDSRVSYISPSMKRLIAKKNLKIAEGDSIGDDDCRRNIDKLLNIVVNLLEKLIWDPENNELELVVTNHLLTKRMIPDIVTFSGGVGACMDKLHQDDFQFGDIGVLMGKKLAEVEYFKNVRHVSKETLNATVIGAGNYSMDISGSTIEYGNISFPLKRLLVHEIYFNCGKNIHTQIESFLDNEDEHLGGPFAFYAKGLQNPNFATIESFATEIVQGMRDYFVEGNPCVIIVKEDMGKALGQAIKRRIPEHPIICIDGIECHSGDFVDIGVPLSKGKVIPVMVRSLVFG